MTEVNRYQPGQVATLRQFLGALILTLALANLLAVGFLPTSTQFWNFFSTHITMLAPLGEWGHACMFPFLAFCFYFSLGRNARISNLKGPSWNLWIISILPILLALAFGLFRPPPNLLSRWDHPPAIQTWFWFLICVPIGEELLFRGWLYAIIERVQGPIYATRTNPLPLALWMSSLAFSLWHLQNWGFLGASLTLFQVGYTFFTGLWLGVLRWKSRSLWPAIAAHIVINALAG